MDILRDARTIIDEAIRAVLPDAAVRRALEHCAVSPGAIIVAVGKAAWRMANAAHDTLEGKVRAGLVITKYGHSEGPIGPMEIVEAGHPIPDANSIRGAEKALALVSGLTETDHVIFLISGGGSALFELPLPGVTLNDIQSVTSRLLTCGADIVEMNTIRKRLSGVKGGRFGQACAPAHVLTIALSDVLGDAPDAIASGPAAADMSTCADALAILNKYDIDLPDRMLNHIRRETPKSMEHVHTETVGNVSRLCETATCVAERLGYRPLLLTTTLDSEARDAGMFLASIVREIVRSGQPVKPPCAVVLGGEVVVHVRGTGRGGRNQEFALAAAKGIDGLENVAIFSVGSDGTDGPTDAAGGIVTGDFAARCRAAGLSIDTYLANNDAYAILSDMDGLIITGPTGTNVNDLAVALVA